MQQPKTLEVSYSDQYHNDSYHTEKINLIPSVLGSDALETTVSNDTQIPRYDEVLPFAVDINPGDAIAILQLQDGDINDQHNNC